MFTVVMLTHSINEAINGFTPTQHEIFDFISNYIYNKQIITENGINKHNDDDKNFDIQTTTEFLKKDSTN
jgi:hypothetical protein